MSLRNSGSFFNHKGTRRATQRKKGEEMMKYKLRVVAGFKFKVSGLN
jgi:hypothetical protein